MFRLSDDLIIIENKEEYLDNYNKECNRFMFATPYGFDENSNFPIVVKYESPWDAHFCGDYFLVTETDLIKKAIQEEEEGLKNSLKMLNNLKKIWYD